jgi:hypothetical protein
MMLAKVKLCSEKLLNTRTPRAPVPLYCSVVKELMLMMTRKGNWVVV